MMSIENLSCDSYHIYCAFDTPCSIIITYLYENENLEIKTCETGLWMGLPKAIEGNF